MLLQGRDVSALGRMEIARRVAVVPQDFSVQFAYTVGRSWSWAGCLIGGSGERRRGGPVGGSGGAGGYRHVDSGRASLQ